VGPTSREALLAVGTSCSRGNVAGKEEGSTEKKSSLRCAKPASLIKTKSCRSEGGREEGKGGWKEKRKGLGGKIFDGGAR